MALPKETLDRIEKDADAAASKVNDTYRERETQFTNRISFLAGYKEGHIAGATAEHNHMQEELKNAQDAAIMFCNKYNAVATQLADTVDRAQNLVEALEQIANSPMPANEQEMYSWIETARMLAIGSLQQWNAGKEVEG